MFKKDFIMKDGKIKECSYNIAKMNILEYLFYEKFFMKKILDVIKDIKYLKKPIIELLEYILLIIIILLAPISFPIIAYYHIKDAQEFVEAYKISKR
jgi:hypothetical protein